MGFEELKKVFKKQMLAKTSNSLKFTDKIEALRKMRMTNTNSKMVNHIKHTEIVAIT